MLNKIERPTVLVLLAVYNGEKFLPQQIASILSQDHVNIRITISLDQCTDNSEFVCKKFAATDSRVTILPSGGNFGNAAYNFFYLMASTSFEGADYIALSDQDDLWLETKMKRATHKLIEQNADGYSSNLTAFREANEKRWTIRKSGSARKFDYLFQGASAGCTYVFSRKAANLIASRIHAVNTKAMTRPSHDWAFYAICRSYGMRWWFDSEYSGILYRQHEGNFYGASNGAFEEFRKKWRILRSGWFREQINYNAEFLLGSEDEIEVLSAVNRGTFGDRLWLLSKVHQFRRERSKRLILAFLFLTALY